MYRTVVRVDADTRIWVITDLHLRDGEHGNKWDAFRRVVWHAVERDVPIVCGGDFFHLFLGRRECWTPLQRAVYDLLATAQASGLRFFWVRGNRDLHPESWRSILAGVGAILHARVGPHALMMVHGHGIDPGDRADWIWQRVLHHPVTWWLLRRLPAGGLTRLAHGVERRLHRGPSRRARPIPWRLLYQQAIRFVNGRPVRWFLFGHFHVFARIVNPVGSPREILCVPSWDEGARILELSADGTWTLLDAHVRPLDIRPLEPMEIATPNGSPPKKRGGTRPLG